MIGHVTVKPGAGFPTLGPAGIRILAALDNFAREHEIQLTVTSGSEPMGRLPTDPHPRGAAVDVAIAPSVLLDLLNALHAELGPLFTVLYEVPNQSAILLGLKGYAYVNPLATGPHIHIQPVRGTTWPPT